MKITVELARKYLGNAKFCSLAEAVSCARYLNDIITWEAVLMREDISPQRVIQNAKEVDSDDVWNIVFKRDNVEVLLKSLSIQKALDYANDIDCLKIWQRILFRDDVYLYITKFSASKAIQFARKYDNHVLWEIVLQRGNVQKYLG